MKNYKPLVIEIVRIIKNSELSKASIANQGLSPEKYDVEVVDVATKIIDYLIGKI